MGRHAQTTELSRRTFLTTTSAALVGAALRAAAKEVQGYQPCVVGPFTYRGGGIRTAYIET
jgi:hypothetical protein